MGVSACRPTRAEIDLGACVGNLQRLRQRIGGKDLWPVVKADAYGHGAVEVVRALASEHVEGFCVATASEERELRRAGVERPILVLAGTIAGGADDGSRMVVEFELSCAVQDREGADALAQASRAAGIGPVSVHVKIDTGMGRFGVPHGEAIELAAAVDDEPTLSLDGVFSNLASGDSFEPDDPGTRFARPGIAVCRGERGTPGGGASAPAPHARQQRRDPAPPRGLGARRATRRRCPGRWKEEVNDPALGRAHPGRGVVRVQEVATWADTIPHEILRRVGARVPRVYDTAEQAPTPALASGRHR